MAECVAMRYSEFHLSWAKRGTDERPQLLAKGTLTLETLVEADLNGQYALS